MRKVKVGFSKGHTLFSKAICALDKSPFSHTFFCFHSDNLDRDMLYHANLMGVNFIGRSRFETMSDILIELEFEISEETYVKLMQFCIDKAGTGYDLRGLVGKALIRLRLTKSNLWNDHLKSVDCSELVNEILRQQGIETRLDLSVDGPKQIFEFLNNLQNPTPKAP